MLPAENVAGAIAIAGMGYFLSTHMALTRMGAMGVRVVTGLFALGILVAPFLS